MSTDPVRIDQPWLHRVLARLDAEAIAATAAELIAIPSVSGTPAEQTCLDHVADWLTEHDIRVRRWSVPAAALPVPDGWSAEIERSEVPALVAAVGPDDGPGLLVNAHLDVVPADQPGWTRDPFTATLRDGWLTGRGAVDTKGGLAAGMHVLVALAAESQGSAGAAAPPGRLVLAPVVGEEDGGAGTLAALARDAEVRAAVIVEPTDLQVASASAGALRFRISVPGRTAHGSVRHEGVSAIEKGWLVHQALLDLERDRAGRLRHPLVAVDPAGPTPWTICVGRIEGGGQPCDVADQLVLDGRYGVAPHEDPAAARGELETRVAEVAVADDWLREHPPVVAWVGAQWFPVDTPTDDPLVTAFAAAGGATAVAMPYGCDGGLLRQVAGLPVVITGPGALDQAHASDERVAIADLGRFAELLVRGAARWWSLSGG